MTAIFTEVDICSEAGDQSQPCHLHVKMNGGHPDCPVTFYNGKGKPVFSMGSHEVEAFCDALKKLAVDC